MRQVSPHFSEEECQCKCDCKSVFVHPDLPLLMEIVRELNGDKPITPSSVYRCRKHNDAIGGAENSYHMIGMAADMPVDNPVEVYEMLTELFPDQYGFGLYNTFVHVDCRSRAARWDKRNG